MSIQSITYKGVFGIKKIKARNKNPNMIICEQDLALQHSLGNIHVDGGIRVGNFDPAQSKVS